MAADRASTALTGVFAAGAPPLAPLLRTLTVSPARYTTPGETIRVEFAFSNLGGAAATGVRVRFTLPSGVTHVDGSDVLDGEPIAAGESLVAPGGAQLGELLPNVQRRVACSFRVNDPVENGTDLLFQAALATEETPIVGSNVERVVVRSAPILGSTQTMLLLEGPQELRPGDTVVVRMRIANTGSSSANDVRAVLPVPQYTVYRQRTARIAGKAVLEETDEPFDYAGENVVASRLAPGASVDVEFQAIVEAPLPDGTRLRASGAVASREIGEFALLSSELVVTSPVDFANDDTALTVFCDDVVTPGSRVPMTIRALNAGTGDAQNLSLHFDLPAGLAYTPGSAHVDGQSVSDEALGANTVFAFGALDAGRSVEAGISATVTAPAEGGETQLPIAGVLRWKGGERRFSRVLRVRTSSRFTRARNYIEVDRGVAQSREDVTFTAHIFNDGTASENDVRLRVIPGAYLTDVRIAESPDDPVPYAEPFGLGIVQPHQERAFVIRARVASPVPDRSQLTFGAVLEFASGTFDLGTATVMVRSRPFVDSAGCSWERVQHEPLRPGQTHELTLRFTNEGSDVLRDARLVLNLPPELVLDRAQNARRSGSDLEFGDVPAETTIDARVAVRLVHAPREDRTLRIEGLLEGRGISALRFEPIEIPTYAHAEFAPGAQIRALPGEVVNAGERIVYEVVLHNSGDGPAEKLVVRAVPSNLTVYVPGSTMLGGMQIPDDLGSSQLWSQRGLLLTDVNPGVELRIRYEMVVISPLPAGTAIETRAVVEWDAGGSLALTAPVLRVLSSPVLEGSPAGTPISVAQMAPQLQTPPPEAIVPPPPAPEIPLAPLASEREALVETSEPEIDALPERPAERTGAIAYIEFDNAALLRAIAQLERTEAGGVIPHLFAVRAFMPNTVAGADPATAARIANAWRGAGSALERFFVRLTVPRLAVTAKDLEDRESRGAFDTMLGSMLSVEPAPPPYRGVGAVRLSGTLDLDALEPRLRALEQAPLGSVLPWVVAAHIMGTQIESDAPAPSGALAVYRRELLRVFGVLETLPMPEFHRVLGSSANRALDDALAAVLDALRYAVHVGA